MVNFYTQTLGFLLKRRFAIGNEDAAQLRGLMEKGPVKIHLTLKSEAAWH